MLGHQGYITTFSMTPVALEKSMQVHSDMPFLIDETNLYNQGGTAASSPLRTEVCYLLAC